MCTYSTRHHRLTNKNMIEKNILPILDLLASGVLQTQKQQTMINALSSILEFVVKNSFLKTLHT